jgi:hypothetical protein
LRDVGNIRALLVEIGSRLPLGEVHRLAPTSKWLRDALDAPEFGTLCDHDRAYASRNDRLRTRYPQLATPRNLARLLSNDPTRRALQVWQEHFYRALEQYKRTAVDSDISYELERQHWNDDNINRLEWPATRVDTAPLECNDVEGGPHRGYMWSAPTMDLHVEAEECHPCVLLWAYRTNCDTTHVERALLLVQPNLRGGVGHWFMPLLIGLPGWYTDGRNQPLRGRRRPVNVSMGCTPNAAGDRPHGGPTRLEFWAGDPNDGDAIRLSKNDIDEIVTIGAVFCRYGGPAT